MYTLSLRKSMIVSFLSHIILILILSITIRNLPFTRDIKTVTVTIEAASYTIAAGLEDTVMEPTSEQVKPTLTERTSDTYSVPDVPEKTTVDSSSLKPEKVKNVKESLENVSTESDTEAIKDTVIPTKDPVEKTSLSDMLRKTLKNVVDDSFSDELDDTDPIEEVNDTTEKVVDHTTDVNDVDDSTDIAKTDTKVDDKNDIDEKVTDDTTDTDLDALDKLLTEAKVTETDKTGPSTSIDEGDPLGDAEWTAAPRTVVFFPDIESKIPAEYKKLGKSFSVEVKIGFDKNGLAISVDLLKSSGDTTIDNLFQKELRKVRVKEITEDRTDYVTKEYTINLS